ncbi:A/G-specific adenine glycosylase [Basilea psittacipulmonis]|uniref:Adenine DNA glycosylase n=1 Tax=Basilea psittacipulmonis DSM 24701 TaxID=1072685 RepID=A0A077DGH6_9BURK|nr:A/G-specific adenine glycosylase [Basilea psittacipulmonis]AIL33236.1 hypothetical protein IX83_07960 [Basilea psittacipulmonis DSM 24701]
MFAQELVNWQKVFGRHGLPWQGTQDPYKVWLSEIMLQQTQVSTVIPYYERFIKKFPRVQLLAQAKEDEVLSLWAGLGYYARARNLHRAAQEVVSRFGGIFPENIDDLVSLPGIGLSTAHAIASFCFSKHTPIMDGNVKRVFARYYGIKGYDRHFEKVLWQQAWENVDNLPDDFDMPAYTQGLMDLGATICTRTKPKCLTCPFKESCYAHLNNQQTSLPTPKPKKTVPLKEVYMLIVDTGHSVLLEKRKSSGIWGGLWSLPEFEQASQMKAFVQASFSGDAVLQKMAELTHKFSHYTLLIRPFYFSNPTENRLSESVAYDYLQTLSKEDKPHFKYLDWDALETIGLPKPIQDLLSWRVNDTQDVRK